MSWKRLLVSIPLGFLVMIADGVSLMLVNRLYRPGYPPAWMIHAFYYFDAWPLFVTQRLFPKEGHERGTRPDVPRGGRGRIDRCDRFLLDRLRAALIAGAPESPWLKPSPSLTAHNW